MFYFVFLVLCICSMYKIPKDTAICLYLLAIILDVQAYLYLHKLLVEITACAKYLKGGQKNN